MNSFEQYLYSTVNEKIPSLTKEAMTYSLMNGGKRIRPQLLFAMLKGYGLDEKIGYPCACAIEMIHTYSLIHDDLPAMDNDDLRRGKPSCHKAFGEATAILAGDGLLTKAFEVVLYSECDDTKKVKLVQLLSEYAGVDGMIYGQDCDLKAEKEKNPTFDQLIEIDNYKTAKLLTLPLLCAAVLGEHEEDFADLKEIGFLLGVQFQMQDDILDITQSEEVLGKSTSDQDHDKLTIVSLIGLDRAKEMVNEYDCKLRQVLTQLHGETRDLEGILNFLLDRKY